MLKHGIRILSIAPFAMLHTELCINAGFFQCGFYLFIPSIFCADYVAALPRKNQPCTFTKQSSFSHKRYQDGYLQIFIVLIPPSRFTIMLSGTVFALSLVAYCQFDHRVMIAAWARDTHFTNHVAAGGNCPQWVPRWSFFTMLGIHASHIAISSSGRGRFNCQRTHTHSEIRVYYTWVGFASAEIRIHQCGCIFNRTVGLLPSMMLCPLLLSLDFRWETIIRHLDSRIGLWYIQMYDYIGYTT